LESLSEGEAVAISWQEKPQIAFKSCESAADPFSLDVGDALYIISAAPLITIICLSHPMFQPLSALVLPAVDGTVGTEEIAFATKAARTSTTCGAQSLQHSWIAAS
jgi:hypothetical protein